MSEAQPVAVAEPEMIAVAHAVNDDEAPPAEGTLVPAEVAMGDLEDNPMDSAEEKRVKRMRRNRESAAQSRNRKKQYVDSLEGEIRQLKTTINTLTNENYELRLEHARLTGAPPPVAPEAISVLAPIEPEGGDSAEASTSVSASALPTVATVAISAIAAEAHATANAALTAPSPRKTDALIGLELLSRSASINGGDKEEDLAETEGEVAAEVMDAEQHGTGPDEHPGAEPIEEEMTGDATRGDGDAVGSAAGSQDGSSASSMV